MSDLAPPGSQEDWQEIRDYHRQCLEAYRLRLGAFAFDSVFEQMGRSVKTYFYREAGIVDLFPGFSLGDYHEWAYARHGRAPFTIKMSVSRAGDLGEPWFEFDRPPGATALRTAALYVQELEMRPRPPGLVPGWMKVELAAVGAWDLRSDKPTWEDYEPTGEPQTPESVGVPPPPGAEWALGR